MPVHVSEINTEMVLEADAAPAAGGEAAAPPWKAIDRAKSLEARVARDRCRTSAKGFDD